MTQKPKMQVLLQGIIEPQSPCRNLEGTTLSPQPILGSDSPQQDFGIWHARILHHRMSVLIQVLQDLPSDQNAKNALLTQLQAQAATLARVILQAQALYSNIRLDLASYTVSLLEGEGDLQPLWFGPSPPSYPGEEAISTEMFAKAAHVVAWPAFSDMYLQQALRDYVLSLEHNDENALIYLWRSVEAILFAHDPPEEIDDKVNYEPAAGNLNLYLDKAKKGEWIREIGKLAHRFARHGTSQVGNVTEQQIKVARKRVSELIIRHARYRRNETDFEEPPPDELTDWLKS